MPRDRPVWREYPTQAALRSAIRHVIDPLPFDTPFETALVSDLIAERHYFCRWHGLRPERFKKTPDDLPYRFYGFFSQIGWHPVSWAKCVAAPPSKRELLVRALRDRVEPVTTAFRRRHPLCAHCRTAPSAETHHADPTFETIIEQVWAAVSTDAIDAAWSAWDWFKLERFVIGDHQVIAQTFDRLHAGARLEALCRTCHNATKRRRTAASFSSGRTHLPRLDYPIQQVKGHFFAQLIPI